MKVLAASVLAIVAEVVGNVIVVASVPANVRVLLAVSTLLSATKVPTYRAVQLAAVVPVICMHVTIALVFGPRMRSKLPPLLLIVIEPVDVLRI